MKKLLMFFLALGAIFTLAACKEEEVDASVANQEAVAAAILALDLGDLTETVADFTLPITGEGEVSIDWATNNVTAVAISGNTAAVTRPAAGEGNATAILTATVRKGFESDVKSFTVTVLQVPETEAEKLAEAVMLLEFPVVANTVKEDFELPSGGANDAAIAWVSSDVNVVIGILDGTSFPVTVTRPGVYLPNFELTVTATLTLGDETATKVFDVIVLALPADPTEQVGEALADIDLGNLSFVKDDLVFPATGLFGAEFVWTTDKLDVIDATGVVIQPTTNTVVIITVTATIGTVSEDMDFTAVVVGSTNTFTYRTTTLETDSLNPHVYEMVHESTAMDYMMESLYEFTFKADPLDGFEIVPALAIAEPLDVSPVGSPGTVWEIALNPAAAWANGDLIDADDFMYSYKMLIDPRMANYRGDAFHTGIVVVGAKAYFEQDYPTDVTEAYGLTFDTVGIKKIDLHTLEFTLVSQATAWDVKYNLSGPITGVIDEVLYEANMNPERNNTTYGTDLDTVRSNGAFELVEWQKGKILYFEANPNYYEAGLFQTTHIRMDVIADQSVILQLFNQGKLDVANVGSTEFDNYKYDSRLKLIESTVTWRLVMNGSDRPDGETKEIMKDLDFRMALFHVFDRAELASTLAAPATPSSTLLSSLYLVDVAAGTSYRSTLAGQSVTAGLYPETNGYNFDAAVLLYQAAYDRVVAADSTMVDGDKITIEVLNYTAETSIARNNWVKAQVEFAFPNIIVEAVAHPDRYTKYEEGNFDFGWAGWSGMALDPLGFMIVWENAAYRSEYSFDPEADVTVTHAEVLDLSGVETRTYREWYWSTNPAFYDYVETGNVDITTTACDESLEVVGGDYTVEPCVYVEVLVGGEYYGPDADGDLRTWILAAMEKEIIAQGTVVPLYQLRSAVIYHGRIQFPVLSYQPIMGYGDIKDITYTASDQDVS